MTLCKTCKYINTCSQKRQERSNCEEFEEKECGGFYPGGTPPFYLCNICKYGPKADREYLCVQEDPRNRTWFAEHAPKVGEILWVNNCGLEDNIDRCDHFEELD